MKISLDSALLTDVGTAARKLLAHCRENDWAGYDPYDALNSRIFMALPVLQSRLPRLVLTQLLKRSPINVRSVLQIPKTQNPKGIALFLSALLKAPQLCYGRNRRPRGFAGREASGAAFSRLSLLVLGL